MFQLSGFYCNQRFFLNAFFCLKPEGLGFRGLGMLGSGFRAWDSGRLGSRRGALRLLMLRS